MVRPFFRCVLASLQEGLFVRRSVGSSVGNGFFFNSENEELSQKKVERTHLLVDQTCLGITDICENISLGK